MKSCKLHSNQVALLYGMLYGMLYGVATSHHLALRK